VPRRMVEYIITGTIAAGVAVYLAYALLFPEKF
jgi:K+-transporting ATPase KdpF subunit